MASEREHELPNGDRVIVVDVHTASQNLGKVLASFRAGDQEPLIFSDTGEPEGVVIPFGQWLALLDLADEVAADKRIRDITRERLASARPEDYVPLEDLGWDLPPKPGAKDDG